MTRFGKRQFGNRKIPQKERDVMLEALLVLRVKPLTEREIASIARSHGVAEDKVREMARERGLAA